MILRKASNNSHENIGGNLFYVLRLLRLPITRLSQTRLRTSSPNGICVIIFEVSLLKKTAQSRLSEENLFSTV